MCVYSIGGFVCAAPFVRRTKAFEVAVSTHIFRGTLRNAPLIKKSPANHESKNLLADTPNFDSRAFAFLLHTKLLETQRRQFSSQHGDFLFNKF